jgi:hypothetical protein
VLGDDGGGDGEATSEAGGSSLRRSGKRGSKAVREKKQPKPKVDKSGLVSANEIAAELKVEGREVRGVLRSLGLTKPDVGWAWPKDSAELKDARKKIEEGLKAAKKGKKK